MNARASQSSSSGWVGGAPRSPKSDGVGTIGLPKWCCQIRLTITRAARGRGGPSVSHRARARRTLPDSGRAAPAAPRLGQVDGAVGFEDLRDAARDDRTRLARLAADLELHVGRGAVAD